MSPPWLLLLLMLCFPIFFNDVVYSRRLAAKPRGYITAANNTVALKSSDGESFLVDLPVALQSETIKKLVGDGFSDEFIPLFNVTGKVLAKVIEYCEKHAGNSSDLKAFDAEFLKVEHRLLFDLFLAANDLKIKSLVDLTAQRVGSLMMGKSPHEIREMFNLNEHNCNPNVDDKGESRFSPDNAWAFV